MRRRNLTKQTSLWPVNDDKNKIKKRPPLPRTAPGDGNERGRLEIRTPISRRLPGERRKTRTQKAKKPPTPNAHPAEPRQNGRGHAQRPKRRRPGVPDQAEEIREKETEKERGEEQESDENRSAERKRSGTLRDLRRNVSRQHTVRSAFDKAQRQPKIFLPHV